MTKGAKKTKEKSGGAATAPLPQAKAVAVDALLLDVPPAAPLKKLGQATGLTINEISERTGADRRSVGKWLESAGIEPLAAKGMGNREMKLYGPEALEAVASRKKKTSGPSGAWNQW